MRKIDLLDIVLIADVILSAVAIIRNIVTKDYGSTSCSICALCGWITALIEKHKQCDNQDS